MNGECCFRALIQIKLTDPWGMMLRPNADPIVPIPVFMEAREKALKGDWVVPELALKSVCISLPLISLKRSGRFFGEKLPGLLEHGDGSVVT